MTKLTLEQIDEAEEAAKYLRRIAVTVFENMHAKAVTILVKAARKQLGQQAAAPGVEQMREGRELLQQMERDFGDVCDEGDMEAKDLIARVRAWLAVAPPVEKKPFHSDALKWASDTAMKECEPLRQALAAAPSSKQEEPK